MLVSVGLAIFLSSCLSSPPGQQQQSEIYRDYKRDTVLSQKKENLAANLDGKWVSEDYLQKIARSKSIFAHKKYSTQLLGFDLNRDLLMSGDPYMAGFTEVEGGYRNYLNFDRNKTCYMNDLNKPNKFPSIPKSFDLSYNEGYAELAFPLEKTTERYKKIEGSLDSELRKLVMAGTYVVEGDSMPITFTKEGSVKFLDFNSYKLVSNFGEGVEFDAVVFFNGPEPGHWYKGQLYKYEFSGKRLLLYEVREDWATFCMISCRNL